ncbi:MAG TPA: alpha-hydroxy acid oxidase [Alphaproteobacteria bacterium]|jgi:L-lactate dehydrogenase (cytochrome)/(S)-mandelate dehydrogenase
MSAIHRAASIEDLRRLARRRVPRVAFDYMDGGAGSENGLTRNRAAFDRLRLVPRYLVDVTVRDLTTKLFGRRWSMPLGIAPTGLAGLIWPGADLILARAAVAADVPFILSTAATESLEEVAKVAPDHGWFQLYAGRDQDIVDDLVRRAHAAGYPVLVVTVDIPVPGKRDRDIRNGLTLPLRPRAATIVDVLSRPRWLLASARAGSPRFRNIEPYVKTARAISLAEAMAVQTAGNFDWGRLARVRDAWPGKLVVKGLMAPEDVARAAEEGADGVILSNHGGRQLDAGVAPIEILPRALEAAAGRIPVMLDSGIRQGGDVVRALALGAAFCFVARATLYGVAAGGAAGAAKALAILRDETDRTLGQLGCRSLGELGPDRLWTGD